MKQEYIRIIIKDSRDALLILKDMKHLWIKITYENYEKIDFIKTHYIKNKDFPVGLKYNINTKLLSFADGDFTVDKGMKEVSVNEFISMLKPLVDLSINFKQEN